MSEDLWWCGCRGDRRYVTKSFSGFKDWVIFFIKFWKYAKLTSLWYPIPLVSSPKDYQTFFQKGNEIGVNFFGSNKDSNQFLTNIILNLPLISGQTSKEKEWQIQNKLGRNWFEYGFQCVSIFISDDSCDGINHKILFLCPVHLPGQNIFCLGQNQICLMPCPSARTKSKLSRTEFFCPGQKFLSQA